MRFAVCLIVLTTFLIGCTDAEQRHLGDQLDQIDEPQRGTILLALISGDGSIGAVVKGSPSLGAGDPIRIASITKAFTAALVLTLVDDGLIDLDASASAYVPRLSLPANITVRHLLNQRSGLADYTLRAIYGNTEDGNSTAWAPDELYRLIEDESMTFQPGSRFEYTNTNYLILGLLIEEATGRPYHQALRKRILDPLGLDATYLSHYEQGERPREGFTEQLGDPLVPVDLDYTAIATTVWSAGGLVSNALDVHEFFTALSRGEVLSPPLFSEMTTATGIDSRRDPARRYDYGLGVELFDAPTLIYGARGNLPGYITLVMHSPETLKTFLYISTNDQYHNVSWTLDNAAEQVGN
jgi:D-alanyl-D-alanine carboxypeptidase